MSIKNTNNEIIIEGIIKKLVSSGNVVSVDAIETEYKSITDSLDLSQPSLGQNSDIDIQEMESASASELNNINNSIQSDLTTMYRAMINSTDRAIQIFDRWRNKSEQLNIRLKKLSSRIDNLLTTQLNKSSYYITDNFDDLSLVNMIRTTAFVSLVNNNVTLTKNNTNTTRVNLNYIDTSNVSFTCLTVDGLQSVVNVNNAALKNAFKDSDDFWQNRVYMRTASNTVTGELKVKISDTAIQITKIAIRLLSANNNTHMQITPLTSTDGVNFIQLNVTNPSVSVRDNTQWIFPVTDVTHIKFIMIKSGFDFLENNSYIYEFGAQSIAFYTDTYGSDTQVLFSSNLSYRDINDIPIPFTTVELQTCESIPQNTDIRFSVSVSNDPIHTYQSYTYIDPINRDNGLFPKKINFSKLTESIHDNIKISYNATGEKGYVNPAAKYYLLQQQNNKYITSTIDSANIRYLLTNQSTCLLDFEIDPDINIDSDGVQIFRNVGNRNDKIKVRGIQRGWTYEEPYYSTYINIVNPSGLTIDVGGSNIIVDKNYYHGAILLSYGVHKISIHKDQWLDVPSNINSIVELSAVDNFFPYNQKMLIEGYDIVDHNNPYRGIGLFAGYAMRQVDVNSLLNVIPADDYSVFAMDSDTADGITKSSSSYVFVVNLDKSNSDFLDELFTVNLKIINDTYRYIILKAEVSSSISGVTPLLDGYTIKLNK